MSTTQLFDTFSSFGFENNLRRMIVLDTLIFNEDRHYGNFGFLFNTKTLKIEKMAPVFDFNLSLFPYAMKEDFEHFGDYLERIGPKIGDDFTRIGQNAVFNGLQNSIKDLMDFRFKFRGDDAFAADRVIAIEEAIQKQAKALLSKEQLYTRDVFIPEMRISRQNRMGPAYRLADEIVDLLSSSEYMFSEMRDDAHMVVIVEPEDYEKDFSVEIDCVSGGLTAISHGQSLSSEKLNLPSNRELSEMYEYCAGILRDVIEHGYLL